MPYQPSKEKLELLTKLAMIDPEISGGLEKLRLQESDLQEEVQRRAAEIWKEIGKE